jgi:hypothetical protein
MEKTFEINYEKDSHIDESNLHVEWLRQSEISRKYVNHFALTEKQAREAKKKMEFLDSQLEEKLRKDPTKYGLEKTTDAVVKQATIRQPEYQQAYQEWIDAEYEKSIARGALQDMRERLVILEGLNYLYNTGYFSVPDSDRNIVNDRIKFNRKEDNAKTNISNSLKDYRKKETEK